MEFPGRSRSPIRSSNADEKILKDCFISNRPSYYQLDINYNPHTEHLKLQLLPIEHEKGTKVYKDKAQQVPTTEDAEEVILSENEEIVMRANKFTIEMQTPLQDQTLKHERENNEIKDLKEKIINLRDINKDLKKQTEKKMKHDEKKEHKTRKSVGITAKSTSSLNYIYKRGHQKERRIAHKDNYSFKSYPKSSMHPSIVQLPSLPNFNEKELLKMVRSKGDAEIYFILVTSSDINSSIPTECKTLEDVLNYLQQNHEQTKLNMIKKKEAKECDVKLKKSKSRLDKHVTESIKRHTKKDKKEKRSKDDKELKELFIKHPKNRNEPKNQLFVSLKDQGVNTKNVEGTNNIENVPVYNIDSPRIEDKKEIRRKRKRDRRHEEADLKLEIGSKEKKKKKDRKESKTVPTKDIKEEPLKAIEKSDGQFENFYAIPIKEKTHFPSMVNVEEGSLENPQKQNDFPQVSKEEKNIEKTSLKYKRHHKERKNKDNVSVSRDRKIVDTEIKKSKGDYKESNDIETQTSMKIVKQRSKSSTSETTCKHRKSFIPNSFQYFQNLRREVSFSQLNLKPVKSHYSSSNIKVDVKTPLSEIQNMRYERPQKKEKFRKKRGHYKLVEKRTVLSEMITKKERSIYNDEHELAKLYARVKAKRNNKTNRTTRTLICTENLIETSFKSSDSSSPGYVVEGIEPPKRLGFTAIQVDRILKRKKMQKLHKTVFSVLEIKPTLKNPFFKPAEQTFYCAYCTSINNSSTNRAHEDSHLVPKDNTHAEQKPEPTSTQVIEEHTKSNLLKDLDSIIRIIKSDHVVVNSTQPKIDKYNKNLERCDSQPHYSMDDDESVKYSSKNAVYGENICSNTKNVQETINHTISMSYQMNERTRSKDQLTFQILNQNPLISNDCFRITLSNLREKPERSDNNKTPEKQPNIEPEKAKKEDIYYGLYEKSWSKSVTEYKCDAENATVQKSSVCKMKKTSLIKLSHTKRRNSVHNFSSVVKSSTYISPTNKTSSMECMTDFVNTMNTSESSKKLTRNFDRRKMSISLNHRKKRSIMDLKKKDSKQSTFLRTKNVNENLQSSAFARRKKYSENIRRKGCKSVYYSPIKLDCTRSKARKGNKNILDTSGIKNNSFESSCNSISFFDISQSEVCLPSYDTTPKTSPGITTKQKNHLHCNENVQKIFEHNNLPECFASEILNRDRIRNRRKNISKHSLLKAFMKILTQKDDINLNPKKDNDDLKRSYESLGSKGLDTDFIVLRNSVSDTNLFHALKTITKTNKKLENHQNVYLTQELREFCNKTARRQTRTSKPSNNYTDTNENIKNPIEEEHKITSFSKLENQNSENTCLKINLMSPNSKHKIHTFENDGAVKISIYERFLNIIRSNSKSDYTLKKNVTELENVNETLSQDSLDEQGNQYKKESSLSVNSPRTIKSNEDVEQVCTNSELLKTDPDTVHTPLSIESGYESINKSTSNKSQHVIIGTQKIETTIQESQTSITAHDNALKRKLSNLFNKKHNKIDQDNNSKTHIFTKLFSAKSKCSKMNIQIQNNHETEDMESNPLCIISNDILQENTLNEIDQIDLENESDNKNLSDNISNITCGDIENSLNECEETNIFLPTTFNSCIEEMRFQSKQREIGHMKQFSDFENVVKTIYTQHDCSPCAEKLRENMQSYKKKANECHEYAQKVRIESGLKNNHSNAFKEIPLTVLLGRQCTNENKHCYTKEDPKPSVLKILDNEELISKDCVKVSTELYPQLQKKISATTQIDKTIFCLNNEDNANSKNNTQTKICKDKSEETNREKPNSLKQKYSKLFKWSFKTGNEKPKTKSILSPNAKILLKTLTATYKSAKKYHFDIIAKYIRQDLITNTNQLEAAMVYLSCFENEKVNLTDFEEYCDINKT